MFSSINAVLFEMYTGDSLEPTGLTVPLDTQLNATLRWFLGIASGT
jgi:hypothetical protein